jgi:GTP:adenosylcobinamide-phosphate guanylyltransferase
MTHKFVPKPLVTVGGECLISRWMRNISTDIGEGQTDCEISISKVYVVVS